MTIKTLYYPTDAQIYIQSAHQLMHIHKIVYIKTFKIAPTCFDPKIIFRELHCSSQKSHFFKNTHWI